MITNYTHSSRQRENSNLFKLTNRNAHSVDGRRATIGMDEVQKLKAENLKLKEDHEKEIKMLKLEHKIQVLELEKENERLKHELEITKIRSQTDGHGFQPKANDSEEIGHEMKKRVKDIEKKLENNVTTIC